MVDILKAYGYVQIPSKNPYMMSFTDEENTKRLNYYFSTGTVTIQSEGFNIKIWKDINTPEEMEKKVLL